MCSALRGSEGPFCVNSPQTEKYKVLHPRFPSSFFFHPPSVFFAFFSGLDYNFMQRKQRIIDQRWLICNTWQLRSLNGWKQESFFGKLTLICLSFIVWDRVRLHFPSLTKTAAELHLQLWMMFFSQTSGKKVFFLSHYQKSAHIFIWDLCRGKSLNFTLAQCRFFRHLLQCSI